MKLFFGFIALLTVSTAFAQIKFSDTTDLDKAHSEIRLADVQYRLLPSKTEVRRIPGCRLTGNASRDCNEVIFLEKQPVVEVLVAYQDGIFRDSDRRLRKQYFTLILRPEAFSAQVLAELKVSRRSMRVLFVELSSNLVTRNIQVLDVRNSTFCPIDNEPYPRPGCVEVLNYRPGKIQVREVKVIVK